MNIEELVKKFVALASKETLSKSENEEARKLMGQLKKAGMSNSEISVLSNGKWSESTVKGYNTGIKTSEPSPWGDAISLLNDLISTGMSLDDVDTTLTIDKDLKSRDVGLDDIVEIFIDTNHDHNEIFAPPDKHIWVVEPARTPVTIMRTPCSIEPRRTPQRDRVQWQAGRTQSERGK